MVWSADTVDSEVGLNKDLDGFDVQNMTWMEGIGGLWSSNANISFAAADLDTEF